MDFNLPPDDDPRRLDIRDWLRSDVPRAYAEIAAKGYAVPHWSRPWGLGADPELQVISDQELAQSGIRLPHHRNPVPINNCGQSVLIHGTEAQKERFLPPALACTEIWCMLFSEPSAGSDIGALRTRAQRVGEHYVVNGQNLAAERVLGLPRAQDPIVRQPFSALNGQTGTG
ncbi:MAG: hypothetical protein ACK5IB_11840 [Qingshengfaniella sp.]